MLSVKCFNNLGGAFREKQCYKLSNKNLYEILQALQFIVSAERLYSLLGAKPFTCTNTLSKYLFLWFGVEKLWSSGEIFYTVGVATFKSWTALWMMCMEPAQCGLVEQLTLTRLGCSFSANRAITLCIVFL